MVLFSLGAAVIGGAAAASSPPNACLAELDKWCNTAGRCPKIERGCAAGQRLWALNDLGDEPHGQRSWRCYAENNTNVDHTRYIGGRCYCTRPELASVCNGPKPPAPAPPEPRPLPTPADAKNVLFIAVDDMRPMMNLAYNFSLAHTPNLDDLAREGLTFTRAYCNYAFCSPSRNSFMSGRRPDTTRVWEFKDSFRQGNGLSWTSLPGYFKRFGYLTVGSGKLFHPSTAGNHDNAGMPSNDYPRSWSPEFPYFANNATESNQGPADPHECVNPPPNKQICEAKVGKDDSTLQDQKIRDSCIAHLHLAVNEAKRHGSKYLGKPFFVGCGLHKPHVPWDTPAEFFQLFPPPPQIPLPPVPLRYAPQSMPMVAWHKPGNVDFTTAFNATCPDETARTYRRAYYASVAYQDYNIGRLLVTLEELGAAEETIVVVFGDHGWHLGEQDTWAKMTNFEMGVHVPLIIRAPFLPSSAGKRTDVLAELVDLYPTLAALAGLPAPATLGEHVNGTSLAPLFDAPSGSDGFVEGAVSLKTAAFAQFAKTCAGYADKCELRNLTYVGDQFQRSQTKLMGYTVRVDAWRYTVWFPFDGETVTPILTPATELGRELYDHSGDSGMWLDWPGEEVNLARNPQYADVVEELHTRVLGYIRLKTDDDANGDNNAGVLRRTVANSLNTTEGLQRSVSYVTDRKLRGVGTAAGAGMVSMQHHATCGNCIAAGGAWCLASSPPQCVPDIRGMCDSGGPDQHVGWAGYGRCPDPEDWQLQVYLHAPRRPPPVALQQPAAPGCAATCSMSDNMNVTLADPTRAAETFERCGVVVVPELFDAATLTKLRNELVQRQNLTAGMQSGHKLEVPGVRGSNRQELVLPFRHAPAILPALRQPKALSLLTTLLGHPPAFDFASVMVAWPGADAQEFHRDADAGIEAALLLFVPLDPTSATAPAAAPPEMCPCSHVPGSPETCNGEQEGSTAHQEKMAVPMATDDRAPIGSAVVYDPGLVHRGAYNPLLREHLSDDNGQYDPLYGDAGDETTAARDQPRLMLSIALSPHRAGLRARPEVLMGGSARAHVQRWRSALLESAEDSALPCSTFAECSECLAAGKSTAKHGTNDKVGRQELLPDKWRTGCAWCSKAQDWSAGSDVVGACVPDVAARCSSADEHFGESGMNPRCPDHDIVASDYEEL